MFNLRKQKGQQKKDKDCWDCWVNVSVTQVLYCQMEPLGSKMRENPFCNIWCDILRTTVSVSHTHTLTL